MRSAAKAKEDAKIKSLQAKLKASQAKVKTLQAMQAKGNNKNAKARAKVILMHFQSHVVFIVWCICMCSC